MDYHSIFGQVLAGGSPEYQKGETSLGMFREVSDEEWTGPDRLIKVIMSGGPGNAPLWGRNLGFDVSGA